MDRRYMDFQGQFAASSSLNSGSRPPTARVLSPMSEVIEDQPQQRNSDRGYRPCSICNQEYCSCAVSHQHTGGYEASDVEMSIGPNIDSGYTQYGAERLASQTTGDNFGGGSYDMTERQAVYRQDSNEVEVQSGLLQQYSNTGTGFYSSQTPPWPARGGFSLGRPGLNTLADQPSVMATQDDQNTVDYGDEDEDDAEENETIRGSEEQEPAKKLFELEALYQPGQCHLPGCRKGHIFETFQSYRSHIRNVHSKALWCKFPSCPHPRPFANQSDLNRHNEAKHGDKSNKPHKCLRADCAARVKAFKRKDKLREHNTNYHPECCCYLCPRLRWFESFQACAEHTNRHHVHVANG